MNIIVNYLNEVLESLDIPVISKENTLKQRRHKLNNKNENQLNEKD